MNDENEKYEQDDPSAKPTEPKNKPDTPRDEDDIQTISLLDLMAEMADDEPPADEKPTQTLYPLNRR